MSDHFASKSDTNVRVGRTFSVWSWIWANVIGLGLAYGLFALLGDLTEYGLGVTHDSGARNLALLGAVLAGASLFAVLRRRVIAPHVHTPRSVVLGSGGALALGLIVGFAVGGPPFDFMLGVISLGTIGGALQWRAWRGRLDKPGGLLAASIVGWLLAGVAVGAVAVLAGDRLHQLFGAPEDGTAMGAVFFVFILTLLGVVGGAVGGAVEGAALRRRLEASV